MDKYRYGLDGWQPDALAMEWKRTDTRIYALVPTQRALYYQYVEVMVAMDTGVAELYIN